MRQCQLKYLSVVVATVMLSQPVSFASELCRDHLKNGRPLSAVQANSIIRKSLPFGTRLVHEDQTRYVVLHSQVHRFGFTVDLYDVVRDEVLERTFSDWHEFVQALGKTEGGAEVRVHPFDIPIFELNKLEEIVDVADFMKKYSGRFIVGSFYEKKSRIHRYFYGLISTPDHESRGGPQFIHVTGARGDRMVLDLRTVSLLNVESYSESIVDPVVFSRQFFPRLPSVPIAKRARPRRADFLDEARQEADSQTRADLLLGFEAFVDAKGKKCFDSQHCYGTALELRKFLGTGFGPHLHIELFMLVRNDNVIERLSGLSKFVLFDRSWGYHAVIVYSAPETKEKWVLDPLFPETQIVRIDDYIRIFFGPAVSKTMLKYLRSIGLSREGEDLFADFPSDVPTDFRRELLKIGEVETTYGP